MNNLVIFLLSVSGCLAGGSYRVGLIENIQNADLTKYIASIHELGKLGSDIVLLPSSDAVTNNNYDETTNKISMTAKQANVYIVAHLFEKSRCQNKEEKIRSNLVFDREGTIISVYRKPDSSVTNCTVPSPKITTFKTDFGVTFGLFMEEDLVLQNPNKFKDLQHFIVAGGWQSEIPFLGGEQFSSSWAYTNKVNLITHTSVYPSRLVMSNPLKNTLIADVDINGYDYTKVPVTDPVKLSSIPGEDLNQYIAKPLDIEASTNGYKETVCHKNFCCEYDIKTSITGKPTEMNYGLAVFDGMRHYGGSHYIHIQSCGVYACAGLYKRSCSVRFENDTNINFDKIIITANFSGSNSKQYPMIVSRDSIDHQFTFKQNGKQATAVLKDVSFFNFGIFSRDYNSDVESIHIDGNIDSFTFYDYIFNDSVQEFFDYVWIRLRILIFVVSIYILEMM